MRATTLCKSVQWPLKTTPCTSVRSALTTASKASDHGQHTSLFTVRILYEWFPLQFEADAEVAWLIVNLTNLLPLAMKYFHLDRFLNQLEKDISECI